jgi:hypothetical protein
MSVSELALPLSFCLPNGLTVFGLNLNGTLTVYRDIFDDDCYRLHGVSIKNGDCILDIGANTGLFILFLNQIGVNVRPLDGPAQFVVCLLHDPQANRAAWERWAGALHQYAHLSYPLAAKLGDLPARQ